MTTDNRRIRRYRDPYNHERVAIAVEPNGYCAVREDVLHKLITRAGYVEQEQR